MRCCVLIVALLFPLLIRAGHLVGGEIYYECLGNGQYVIGMTMYRDCNASGPNVVQRFDDWVNIAIYRGADLFFLDTLRLFPSSQETRIPLVLNVPCLADTPNLCIAKLEYSDTVTLAIPAGGLHLVNQRCCRTPNALNLLSPSDDFGSTYHAFIPDPAVAPCNSSPRFNEVPPKALCAEVYLDMDYSATDKDNDSLVYKMCTPLHGAGSGNPLPGIPEPPPFDTVVWAFGFDQQYQIPSSPAFTVDATTGKITGRPDQIGTYVFAVCVQEFRDGVFLNENRRDFQVTTTYCEIDAAAAIDSALEECIGLEIQFYNQSTMGIEYLWNFGDSTTLGDTSHAPNPSYIYPDTGIYTIQLIAKGLVCEDTAYLTYHVLPKIEPEFTPPAPDCFDRHRYDFVPEGYYRETTVISWAFGDNDSLVEQPRDSGMDDVRFVSDGNFPVTLYYNDFGCLKSYRDTVTVWPNPDFELLEPPAESCAPFEGDYSLHTANAFKPGFTWFLDSALLSTSDTAFVYLPEVGTYNLLIGMITDSQCIDTVVHLYPGHIEVTDTPAAGFTMSRLSANMYEPYFEIEDHSQRAAEVSYFINNSLLTADRNKDFSLPDTGNYLLVQVVEHENGCMDTTSQWLRVEPEYLFFAPGAFSPDGDGLNDLWFARVFVWSRFEMVIRDRWGETVFKTSDPNHGWNGQKGNDGKDCPIGVYGYDAIIVDQHSLHHRYRGSVTLVR